MLHMVNSMGVPSTNVRLKYAHHIVPSVTASLLQKGLNRNLLAPYQTEFTMHTPVNDEPINFLENGAI